MNTEGIQIFTSTLDPKLRKHWVENQSSKVKDRDLALSWLLRLAVSSPSSGSGPLTLTSSSLSRISAASFVWKVESTSIDSLMS